MQDEMDRGSADLDRVKKDFLALADELTSAAAGLREPGVPVPPGLADEIRRVGDAFSSLQSTVLALSKRVRSAGELPDVDDLTQISQEFEGLGTVVSEMTSRGRTLERFYRAAELVRRLEIPEGEIGRGGQLAMRAAEELRDACMHGALTAAALPAGGTLPDSGNAEAVVALARLVGERDALADGDWDSCMALVEERFGKPMSRAAARGKLTLSPERKTVSECGGPEQALSYQDSAAGLDPVPKVSPPADGADHDSVAGGGAAAGECCDAVAPEAEVATSNSSVPKSDAAGPGGASAESAGVDRDAADFVEQSGTDQTGGEQSPASTSKASVGPAACAGELVVAESGDVDPADGELKSEAQAPTVVDRTTASAALVTCLEARETALAYQIASTWETVHPDELLDVPSSVLKAIVVGPIATDPGAPSTLALQQCFPQVLSFTAGLEGPMVDGVPLRLLAVTAALRPALLAPHTGACSVLDAAMRGQAFPAMTRLADQIRGLTTGNAAVSPDEIRSLQPREELEKKASLVRSECLEWWLSNQKATIIYAPATRVWQEWLAESGLVGKFFAPVNKDDRSANSLSLVLAGAEKLVDSRFISEEVERTDARLRGERLARCRRIEARASAAIEKRAREAAGLLREWAGTIGGLSRIRVRRRQEELAKHRDAILGLIPRCQAELNELVSGGSGGKLLVVSCAMAGESLGSLQKIFSGGGPSELAGRLGWPEALNGPLLWLEGVLLDACLEPSKRTDPMLSLLISMARDNPAKDPEKAFDALCKCGDLTSCPALLEYLERRGMEPTQAAAMQECHERWLDFYRNKLAMEVREATRGIDDAVAADLLTASERAKMMSEVESCSAAGILDFRGALQRLGTVRDLLRAGREKRGEQIRSQLEGDNLAATAPEQYRRILASLERGDYATVNELIDAARAGRDIGHSSRWTDVFDLYFPTFVSDTKAFLASDLGAGGRTGVVESIRKRRDVGPLHVADLKSEVAVRAAEALVVWYQLTSTRSDIPGRLGALFSGLGFESTRVRAGRQSGRVPLFELRCKPLADRDVCPIPFWGSQAGGEYTVLLLTPGLSPDGIVREVRSVGEQSGRIIAVYPGALGESERRELAVLCRERRLSFLLLDEVLIYFCALRGEAGPMVFFACSLPFSGTADVYVTAASFVPEELFFGREAERRALIDPVGPCLVYGGRQLGKTALLRDVERRFHRPQDGSIVRWIDLKAMGIGIAKPPRDIWEEVGRILQNEGVRKGSLGGPQAIAKAVRDWLSATEAMGRRIVLLLDEADAFLDADSRDEGKGSFVELSLLKNLMESTDRKFKIVLAGLHNVQRASTDANTPLAHFGTPVCIGPLLDNGEYREALALVRFPLTALGYRFESDELALRILSHTNYYPSLIQLFCYHLLRRVSDPNQVRYDQRRAPPYGITSQHVDEAYRDQELRRDILNRFTWTLDLDARYRVLALLIALQAVEGRNEGLVDGVSVDALRADAMSWWAEGFEDDSSAEAFRTILDEMVGLGVLRSVSSDRYALRSPNVLNLLGTGKEVEERLLSAVAVKPVPGYEPAFFRRALSEEKLRSPLTALQEGEMFARKHEVMVLFGSGLAGLGHLRQAVEKARRREDKIRFLEEQPTVSGFQKALKALAAEVSGDKHEDDAVKLLVVLPSCPWGQDWIRVASEEVRAKTSKRRFLRILFVADPVTALACVRESCARRNASGALTETRNVSLQPWTKSALRHWIRDVGYGPGDNAEVLDELWGRTGGWTELVHQVARTGEHGTGDRAQLIEAFLADLPESCSRQQIFGPPGSQTAILRAISDYGAAVTAAELGELLDGTHEQGEVDESLAWAELLRYVNPAGNGKWELDPIVKSILGKARDW